MASASRRYPGLFTFAVQNLLTFDSTEYVRTPPSASSPDTPCRSASQVVPRVGVGRQSDEAWLLVGWRSDEASLLVPVQRDTAYIRRESRACLESA
jgi:hypothetical protein